MVGIDIANSEQPRHAHHVLLRPVGLELRGMAVDIAVSDSDWTAGNELIRWERIELEEVSPDATERCIWDFLSLSRLSPEGVLEFADKWGLFDFGYDAAYMSLDKSAWADVADWQSEADHVTNILRAIVTTEAGDLVSESELFGLRDGEDRPEVPPDVLLQGFEAWSDKVSELLLRRWRTARKAGEGLALQRRLLANLVAQWVNPLDIVPHWDARGRRLQRTARGVKEIVGAQLALLFTAPELDVFTCSVCGDPFPLGEGSRRPRRGASRFCSPKCRQAAKRADNLASWHRNKPKHRSRKKMSRKGARNDQKG